jgi:uncharacterized DUF497 family protein
METTFEWDIEKARSNLAKHGVSFDEACFAILDPHRVEDIDDRFGYDEERLQIIGLSSQRILFVVTNSHAQDHYRIISARPARRHEESRYLRNAP